MRAERELEYRSEGIIQNQTKRQKNRKCRRGGQESRGFSEKPHKDVTAVPERKEEGGRSNI